MILDEKKKKKDCSSITYTTGDIAANIKHFNKCMGTDFNNPSTEEAKANAAAKKAADNIGTISAASPDGGNSINTTSLSTGEGTGMSEELSLKESSVVKDSREVSEDSSLSWGWEKSGYGGVYYVAKTTKISKDSPFVDVDFHKTYATEEEAKKAFNRYYKKFAAVNETLTEAKRYVRRYYVRPQNIFCSNKTEILQTLIQFEDKDCIIYTLNNLGDEKDVTKLTNNDIIYYYQDGILYDKNMMRLMDYDLYIKHEEDRPKINIETASDSSLSKVYADRLTGLTEMLDSEDDTSLIPATIRKFILYCHTNKLNGKKYFGITSQKNINRWRNGEGYKNQPVFYKAIQKYGWDNFNHEIIKTDLSEAEAKKLEQQYIKEYHTFINDPQSMGYNTTLGGESNLRYETEEERTKAHKLNQHNTYIRHKADRLNKAKQDYIENPDFYKEKNKQNYLKHRNQYLAQGKEFQAELKYQLDTIRILNTLYPNRLKQKDLLKIQNFRNCRNSSYINFLLSFFTQAEIETAQNKLNEIKDSSKFMDEAFSLDFVDVNVYGEILTEGKLVDNICCICGEKIEGYGNNPEPYMTAEKGEKCCDACNLHYVIPARLDQLDTNEEIYLKDK